ncbi:MAG TPA: aspartyl/asparaginyl beta-hydroxylase domain-containing protein [Pseudobdellovibrionaceae bacterium]|nr:aspartyl/asparaginyl beta-hydroxylase domain-containing protein [Pseudobdellovibrionaceae bacterium]
MIFERLDRGLFSVDIEKLRNFVVNEVLPQAGPPHMLGQFFGGWSVWSSNGETHDGWQRGELRYAATTPGERETLEAQSGILPSRAYRVPTPICRGPLAELLLQVRALGLEPSRARLSLLKAHGRSSRHRDAEEHEYCVRLHVPILTSPDAVFACDEGEAHLPADGSAYLLSVNRWHQVFNRGEQDRLHLIMNVVDRPGVSRFHRWETR